MMLLSCVLCFWLDLWDVARTKSRTESEVASFKMKPDAVQLLICGPYDISRQYHY